MLIFPQILTEILSANEKIKPLTLVPYTVLYISPKHIFLKYKLLDYSDWWHSHSNTSKIVPGHLSESLEWIREEEGESASPQGYLLLKRQHKHQKLTFHTGRGYHTPNARTNTLQDTVPQAVIWVKGMETLKMFGSWLGAKTKAGFRQSRDWGILAGKQ